MSRIRDVSHHDIFRHPEHCVNQIATRVVASGEVIAVFNEERFPYHHDSGQTLLTRSGDGGLTWSTPEVVLPWSDKTGNWDCGFCELADGTWLVNLTITGHFKRGIRSEGVSWAAQPQHHANGATGPGPTSCRAGSALSSSSPATAAAAGRSRSRSMSGRSSMAAAGWAAGSCLRAAS